MQEPIASRLHRRRLPWLSGVAEDLLDGGGDVLRLQGAMRQLVQWDGGGVVQ